MTDEPTWRKPPLTENEVPTRWWDPSRKMVRSLRRYHAARTPLGRGVQNVKHRFWSAVTSCDVPLNTKIGLGFNMPHATGIVIHPYSVLGENCMVMQNVTIGGRGTGKGYPIIGRGVDIGPGACVLGGITVGDGAQIGANAVVIADVPPRAVAAGVPARIIKTDAR